MKIIALVSLLAVVVHAKNEITPEEGTSSRQGRFFFFLKKSQSTGCPACAPTINIGYTDVVPIVVSSFDGDKPLCGWKFTYDGKKPPSITCSQFQLFPFYESLHIYDDALTNRFIREYTGVQGPVSLTLPASGVANVVLRRSGTKLMSRIECTITGGGEPACPDPFVAVSNTCIHVGDTVASWDGAKTYCEGLNGQLAVLSDLNTHQAVADYLEAAGMPPGGREAGTRMQSSTGRKGTGVTDVARSWLRSPTARIPKFERPDEIFWIGARINAAGDLEWLDGTVLPATSLSWANGFPDGNLANECAALVEASNYKVANKACTDTGYHPLCQTAPI